MTKQQTVISLGADNELVSLRDAVLRSVGINVFSTTNVEEAYQRLNP